MTIVVTGATGHLGQLTVKALLARGVAASDIVAGGRNAGVLQELAALGVRTATIDYTDPASLDAALVGADKVLLISGTAPGRARCAARRGDRRGEGGRRRAARLHQRTEGGRHPAGPGAGARGHRGADPGVRPCRSRSCGTTGTPRTTWTPRQQAAATGEIVGSAGDGRVASASRADFAEAAAVVLTTDGHLGRTYELAGDVAWNFDEFAAVLSEVAGRPVTYRSVSTEEHIEILQGFGLDAGTAGFVAALDANIR